MTPSRSVYLDHAAATPVDPEITAAMRQFEDTHFANPSSLYTSARTVKHELEAARAQVADTLGAKKTEIIFTAGATESINLAIRGVASAHPGSRVMASAIEHDAILACLNALSDQGHPTSLIPVPPSGLLSPEAVLAAIDDETVLVSVMAANNEIGTLQPIAKITQTIARLRGDRIQRGIGLPLLLHTDATAAAGATDLHVSRLGVDLMTLSGGKIYGPRSVGMLYVRTGVKLQPIVYGGGQERGLRSGTEDVAGIIGFATALTAAQTHREAENRRLSALRDELWQSIQRTLPTARLNGDPRRRLAANLNLIIPGTDGEALVLQLDKLGVSASTGSACSTGDVEPSHVLLAIGLTEAQANASLRLTLGRQTTAADIIYVAQVLPQAVAKARSPH